MPGYTERFTEVHKKLAVIYPVSNSGTQNTGWLDVSLYHRIFIHICAGNIGTSLDGVVEVATDAAGSNPKTLKSITQLTEVGSDDNSDVGIEIQSEELSIPPSASLAQYGKYKYLRYTQTASGATIASAVIYGVVARYYPADVTNWDEIVD